MNSRKEKLQNIISQWVEFAKNKLGSNLIGIVQYGSTTQEILKDETDVDLMLIFNNLPKLRKEIWSYLKEIESNLENELEKEFQNKIYLSLNPKRKDFLKSYSPLFLDMIEKKIIHFDPENLIQNKLKDIEKWLIKNGAYKVQKGQLWYWVLNPNFKWGDVGEYGD